MDSASMDNYHNEANRPLLLLEQAYKLLNKQNNSRYVLNLLEETVFYDEAECDGHCLMDDIADCLDLGK